MNYAQNSARVQEHESARPQPKSAWGVLLFLFCIVAIAAVWVGTVLLFRAYRQTQFPPDAFLTDGTRVGNVLLYVSPCLLVLAAGMIIGNFLIWLIPPARAALNREAGGDAHFSQNQIALAKLGACFAAISLPLCFLGASFFWAVSSHQIDVHRMFALRATHYDWSAVTAIETGCHRDRHGTTYEFVVHLADGVHVDLMEESPEEFVTAYPQIQSALAGRRYQFSSRDFVGPCAAYAPYQLREILTNAPTQ